MKYGGSYMGKSYYMLNDIVFGLREEYKKMKKD